ncbi:MAG: hypothetical protein IKP00_13150 [Victivallales bacterium]|nr:hypothetical protein [Victivallales bacterium]
MKSFCYILWFVCLGCIFAAELDFQYQSTILEEAANYRVFQITYDSPEAPFWKEARQVKAFYFEPKVLPKEGAPAVLCMHVLGGNGQITKSIASYFADHGLPALMPQMPLFLDRRPAGSLKKHIMGPDGPRYLSDAFRAVPGDMRRSVDFLASRPGVDPLRLNIIGTSLGGILGVSTFANDNRLDKAVFLLTGGGLKEILQQNNPEVTPIRTAMQNATPEQAATLDKLCDYLEPMNYCKTLAERVRAGRIRMYNAELDTLVPPARSNALASGLGLTTGANHVILPQLDHYTAIAAMPKVLDEVLPFFTSAKQTTQPAATKADETVATLRGLANAIQQLLVGLPADGRVARIAVRFSISQNGNVKQAGNVKIAFAQEKFLLSIADGKGLEGLQSFTVAAGEIPWCISPNGTAFIGENKPNVSISSLMPDKFHLYRRMGAAMFAHTASTGSLETMSKLLQMKWSFEGPKQRTFVASGNSWNISIELEESRDIPVAIRFSSKNTQVSMDFSEWEDALEQKVGDFTPPKTQKVRKVDSTALLLSLRQVLHSAWSRLVEPLPTQNPLCGSEQDVWFEKGLRIERPNQFPVLIFAGTPEEMGRQHGNLCRREINRSYDCLRLVAGGYLLMKNEWFYDTIVEAQRRSAKNTPERFLIELDAMSAAAGMTSAQGREIGFFPELFHCSGIAAHGKATTGGQVVHARVLDYMRDIGLQTTAQVQVYIPDGFLPWISVGFAGFNGTVTAMNAEGLAMGEMGGRGEGNWDGLPMSYLMRRIMEECRTVAEARKMIANTPLTCEYYYVLSDKTGDMMAVETRAGESPTFLAAGEKHPLLREAFEDIAWITAPSRQPALCERLHQYYGRIDAETMKEIIKRPVAMASNLHDAIFLPQSLDLHFAYADDKQPACNCTYHHLNLADLLEYYRTHLPTP